MQIDMPNHDFLSFFLVYDVTCIDFDAFLLVIFCLLFFFSVGHLSLCLSCAEFCVMHPTHFSAEICCVLAGKVLAAVGGAGPTGHRPVKQSPRKLHTNCTTSYMSRASPPMRLEV